MAVLLRRRSGRRHVFRSITKSTPIAPVRAASSAAVWFVFPYEFLPMPEIGDKGTALDRQGKPVCEAEIVGVKKSPVMDKTAVVTMKVPLEYVHTARFYRPTVCE